jgi:Holliday junction resolvasome RuvABC ATP-dependent DNA helicase subunit
LTRLNVLFKLAGMKNDAKKILGELNLFQNVIGQDRAKREIAFYLESYFDTHLFPSLMLNSPKGMGKTTIATEIAKGLVEFDENGQLAWVPSKKDPNKMIPSRKKMVEINASTIKNIKQFINSTLIPDVVDKNVTVFIDEASELPKDVTMCLLTILNPNPENRTTFSWDEFVMDFDFRKVTFILATSEPQKVFHALLDRLTRIDLEEYTPDQMAKIVQKGAKEVDFKDGVLSEVSQVLRGNARQAQKMANNIKTYLKNRSMFSKKDWEEMKNIFGILPLGLNPTEIQILRLLAARGQGTSLTQLSAQTGLSRDALQRDYELYLLKHQLLEITTSGREITAKGREYLNHILNPNKVTFHSKSIVQK